MSHNHTPTNPRQEGDGGNVIPFPAARIYRPLEARRNDPNARPEPTKPTDRARDDRYVPDAPDDPRKAAIVEAVRGGASLPEAAAAHGVKASVARGLMQRYAPEWFADRDAAIVASVRGGADPAAVATKYGLAETTIAALVRRADEAAGRNAGDDVAGDDVAGGFEAAAWMFKPPTVKQVDYVYDLARNLGFKPPDVGAVAVWKAVAWCSRRGFATGYARGIDEAEADGRADPDDWTRGDYKHLIGALLDAPIWMAWSAARGLRMWTDGEVTEAGADGPGDGAA